MRVLGSVIVIPGGLNFPICIGPPVLPPAFTEHCSHGINKASQSVYRLEKVGRVPVCHLCILAIDQTLADIAEQVSDFNAHESGSKRSAYAACGGWDR